MLDEISEQLCDLLDLAVSLGQVVIVTNAETGWIELSCQAWLPKVYSRVMQPHVKLVSARSKYEGKVGRSGGPGSPAGWKAAAFSDVVADFYRMPVPVAVSPLAKRVRERKLRMEDAAAKAAGKSPEKGGDTASATAAAAAATQGKDPQTPGGSNDADGDSRQTPYNGGAFSDPTEEFVLTGKERSWKNVISIGDAPHEREALFRLPRHAPGGAASNQTGLNSQEQHATCRMKSIKLQIKPHLHQLLHQLNHLYLHLSKIVALDSSLDLEFNPNANSFFGQGADGRPY